MIGDLARFGLVVVFTLQVVVLGWSPWWPILTAVCGVLAMWALRAECERGDFCPDEDDADHEHGACGCE